jgi:hypothetical protein
VNVPDQFEKIFLLVADNRLVPVLEEVPGAAMPEVEGHCVTGQQPPHEYRQGGLTGAKENMGVVVEQGPGKAIGLGSDQKIREPFDEIAAVVIVVENLALFDAAHNDVLQKIGDIKAS